MFYRIKVGNYAGDSYGHQWRELTLAEFTDIIQGEKPLADAEAQTYDTELVRTDYQNQTMYYLSIWSDANDWVNTQDTNEIAQLYNSSGYSEPGD